MDTTDLALIISGMSLGIVIADIDLKLNFI